VGVRIRHNLPIAAPPGVPVPGPGEREELDEGDAPVTEGAGAADDPTRMPVKVDVRVTPATLTLAARDRAELERLVAETVDAFVDDAGIGETLIYNRLVADLMDLPGVLDVDVEITPVSPEAENRRRNVFPSSPGLRPVLEKPVGVEIGGQLVVLHITAKVTLQGTGLIGDAASNKAEALTEIEELLHDSLATLTELRRTELERLLGQPEAFTAELHYTVDYVEAGVRIHQRDAVLPLTGLEGLWIAAVTLDEPGGGA
jgi:hypothetical protein